MTRTRSMNPENMNLHSPLKTEAFLKSVLQPRPQLAVFDCDGTLWPGDAGAGFFTVALLVVKKDIGAKGVKEFAFIQSTEK